MATTQKALDLAQALQSALNTRVAAVAAVAFDTDANPYIQIGAGTAGGKNATVKVMPMTWTAKDVLGLAAISYGPHTVQICTEADSTVAAAADAVDPQTLLNILAECSRMGCRMEWYQTASGTAPTTAGITGANLKATFDSLQYPMISGQ